MTTQFLLAKMWRRLKLLPHCGKSGVVAKMPAPAKNSKHSPGRKIPFLDLP
jgi:hypothetical protein